jgi:hypothetical protein
MSDQDSLASYSTKLEGWVSIGQTHIQRFWVSTPRYMTSTPQTGHSKGGTWEQEYL